MKNLLPELVKDMAMRWCMVTDKPQEILGRSLCRTPQGYPFGVSCDYVTKFCKDFGFGELKGSNTLSFEKLDDNDTILDESGQRRHRQLLGRLLWLVRSDVKHAVCQLSTHVGTATTRDEINIKRLLRYLIRNPECNMIVGCNLDVPGIAGTPQGSVVVMTDADWAGDVEDRRRFSGIAVWVKGSVENTWFPVYASSKKQNMVCLSSGESELLALVGGACGGIATRDQWSKMCNCSPGTIDLCTDSSATLGFVKRKGASRRTRHVDTKVYFMQAWAMEPGQRILMVHGDSQQVADCLTEIMRLIAEPWDFSRRSILSNIDEGVRKIAAHQITASDLNTFTITFPDNMRMKSVMTPTRCRFSTSKSGDELISMKGNFQTARRKGRTTSPHPCQSDMNHVRIWLVSSALESVEGRVWAAHTTITSRGCQHSFSFSSLVDW